ncbi:MAG TPA: FAD:protein FMN transferase, partial [Acidobacteriota bacterium]|nr:FAD:protein FMN transferase [Acidobacteriota bacterium]
MRTMQWVRTFAMMVLIQIGTVPAAFASTTPQRYEFSRLEMGTLFRVVVYATSPEAAEKGAYAALDRVQELNGSLSDYLEDSELNQLCRTAYESPSVVSRELFFVLERALEISRKTDGAFDISIGPLVKLWRKCGSEGKLPDPAQIRTALSRIGYQKILLNRMTRSVR